MTEVEIRDRMTKIEEYLKTEPITSNHAIKLAGEWQGLGMVLNPAKYEGAWSLLHRTRGI